MTTQSSIKSVGASLVFTPAEARPKAAATELLIVPNVGFIAQGSSALTATRLYYMSFVVRTSITVTQMTIEVTAASGAGTGVMVGIYKADTDWQPTTLELDGGELLTDAIAVVSVTGLSTVLQPGNYLIAMHAESNPTLRYARGAAPFINPVVSATILPSFLYVAKAYAALSNPGTAWDTPTYATTPLQYYVFLGITP